MSRNESLCMRGSSACHAIVSIGSLIRLGLHARLTLQPTRVIAVTAPLDRHTPARSTARRHTSAVPSLFSGDINCKPCTRIASPQRILFGSLRTHPNCIYIWHPPHSITAPLLVKATTAAPAPRINTVAGNGTAGDDAGTLSLPGALAIDGQGACHASSVCPYRQGMHHAELTPLAHVDTNTRTSSRTRMHLAEQTHEHARSLPFTVCNQGARAISHPHTQREQAHSHKKTHVNSAGNVLFAEWGAGSGDGNGTGAAADASMARCRESCYKEPGVPQCCVTPFRCTPLSVQMAGKCSANCGCMILDYVELLGHRVRSLNPSTGLITTLAGGSRVGTGYRDGASFDAMFNRPHALAYDPMTETMFVADSEYHRLLQ
jgi:hypothetical protein